MGPNRTPEVEEAAAERWIPAIGARVFLHDAFISHNRGHDAVALATALTAAGCRVWHDADADLADRQVQERISRAVRASRYVVVVIDEAFRVSPWVRAEYSGALAMERQDAVARVITVRASETTAVPDELRQCLGFLHTPGTLSELAAFMRDGNAWSVPLTQPSRTFAKPAISASDYEARAWEADRIRAFTAKLAAKADSDPEFIDAQSLMGWNLSLQRQVTDLPDDQLLEWALYVGQYACHSEELSDRANGIEALLHLAGLGSPLAWEYAVHFLHAESLSPTGSPSVVGVALEWIEGHLDRLTPEAMPVATLATAVAGIEVQRLHELVRRMPDAVRARVRSGSGLAFELLGADERIQWLGQELDWYVAQARAGTRFGIEFELLCRDLMHVSGAQRRWRSDSPVEDVNRLPAALEVVERLVDADVIDADHPVTRMSMWVSEYLFPMVWLAMRDAQTRSRAAALSDRLCERLLRTRRADEVPVCREVSRRMLAGDDLSEIYRTWSDDWVEVQEQRRLRE